ncbi:MAG: hypothetical protein ACTHW2_01740 [Tissierella sp.]|uniref:hypothetical protein n=1 Tax=Tissierella sp. TaxID=41274 RepID=UPI003F9AF961
MKIENIGRLKDIPNKQNLENKKTNLRQNENDKSAVLRNKSQLEYKGHFYDKATVDNLKKISEKSYDLLKNMIKEMITKQGKAINILDPNSKINIDKATRSEASELVSDDGALGVESVSDNIVDFAKALSGGDKSKLDTLKKAIDKGFKEAGKMLGGLPDISQKTYDRIMEKLDNWEND